MNFSADSIMSAVDKKISEKVAEFANQMKSALEYDARVESIDLSKIDVSIEKTGDSEYDINIDLGDLDSHRKQLVKDIYYKNAVRRRKW